MHQDHHYHIKIQAILISEIWQKHVCLDGRNIELLRDVFYSFCVLFFHLLYAFLQHNFVQKYGLLHSKYMVVFTSFNGSLHLRSFYLYKTHHRPLAVPLDFVLAIIQKYSKGPCRSAAGSYSSFTSITYQNRKWKIAT